MTNIRINVKALERYNEQQEKRVAPMVVQKRAYSAVSSPLLATMPGSTGISGNVDVFSGLLRSRALARQLRQNNDYVRRWLQLLEDNVVGYNGFVLQARALEAPGKLDRAANSAIEMAFEEWSRSGECEITGRFTFRQMQELIVTTLACDGEILVRVIMDKAYKYGFAFQLIEPDMLDESYNVLLSNGNRVYMGIEETPYGKPVNYYFRDQKALQNMYGGTTASINDRVKVPASEVIHVYKADRITQSRGITWSIASIIKLQQLYRFDEASVTNATIGAATSGFFENTQGTEFTGQDVKALDDTDEDSLEDYDQIEVSPGVFQKLPPGWKFSQFDPKFPSEQHGPFTEILMRGVAAGLGVNYNVLANDLRGVNYSSLRHFSVIESDTWKRIQQFFVEAFLDKAYKVWLEMALLSGKLGLDYSKKSRYLRVHWSGKRKGYFDPLKDAQAAKLMIDNKLTTRTRVVQEMTGEDYEDMCAQLAEEEKMMERYGITTSATSTPLSDQAAGKPSDQEGKPSDPEDDMSGEQIDEMDAKV